MKVLMITALPPMKFPEADHALHLCEHLADAGVEMHVIAQKGCVRPSHAGITVYPVMRTWSWLELPRLIMAVKRCSPDAVILIYQGDMYACHPMITFAATLCKTFQRNIPFITLCEAATGASPSSFASRVIRKALAHWSGAQDVDYCLGTLLRDSDRLIVVSENIKAALVKQFSGVATKSVIIPCPPIMRLAPNHDGTVRRLKRAALELKEDECLIAYFGRIYAFKGLEPLLQAFQIVNSQSRPVRLIIIGGDLDKGEFANGSYLQKLKALAKDLGIADKILWTGEYAWDSDEASRCLQAADICALPYDIGVSIHNSSFAGACAHRLPIITTQGIITEPVFIHKGNVFFCPPKDPDALAKAIETLIATPELRQQLSRGAVELASEWYSWEKAVTRTVDVLQGRK